MKFKRSLVFLVLLVSFFIILGKGNIVLGSEMTVEEFATLIGYKSIQKINLGTLQELLDKKTGDNSIVEVILKADIYRNEDIIDTKEYFSGVEPVDPDETIIIRRVQLSNSFIEEEKEIFFSYVLEEDESLPGYKLNWRVNNQSYHKEIKVPELKEQFIWYSGKPFIKRIKETQETLKKAPYFYAYAFQSEYANNHSSPSFKLSEVSEVANCFNVFIVFSYEIK